MNPAGQPGQMAPGQSNGQPQQQRQAYKPQDMDNLPLTDAEKAKYKGGLTVLWSNVTNQPADSPQRAQAYKKIADFTAQLNRRFTAAAAGAAPGAGNGPSGATPTTVGATNMQGQQSQQGNRPTPVGMTPEIRRHTAETVTLAPQEFVDQGPEAVAQYVGMQRNRYGAAVVKQQQMAQFVRENEPKQRQLQQKGSGITPDEQRLLTELTARLQQAKITHQNAQKQIELVRKEQSTLKEARGSGAAPEGAANQAARPGQQPGNANNAAIPQQNTSVDSSKPQPTGVAGRLAVLNPQASHQTPQSTQPPQASPVAAPQSAPQQQIKIEPGTSQQGQSHVPPPVNTAIAAGVGAGIPSAGTPTQNTARVPPTPIQSAAPSTGGPQSLSHSAALNLANQNRMSHQPGNANMNPQQQQQQQQGTPQGGGGTPSSAGVMGSAAQQAGHSHAHPGQQQPQATLPTKLPVPKVLPEKAAMAPQPVNTSIGGVAPGRPTYTQGGGTAGGVMGQPILPKIPQIQMEGEGEHVLNRKKLDDIVRQVCGGQAEGQEGNALTPDVEEAILTMADSFVDSLLHSACAIAKQRGSKVLEIRDIQLVLERVYNIRIPGYATDELRAVRKVQPAVGWLTKISAIQASKVTGNKEF